MTLKRSNKPSEFEQVKNCEIILEGMMILLEDFMSEVEPHKKSEYLDEIRKSMDDYTKAYREINGIFVTQIREERNYNVSLYEKLKEIHSKYKKTFNKND